MGTFIAYGLADTSGAYAPVSNADELGATSGGDLIVRASSVVRANAGTGTIFTDANTTTITVGGGASQGIVTIGKSGVANQLNGWLNIASATAATANGDLATGDGTRSLAYTASSGNLAINGSGGEDVQINPNGSTTFFIDKAGGSGVVSPVWQSRNFSGPVAVGTGTSFEWMHQNTTPANVILTSIAGVITDVTPGSEDTDLDFYVGVAGTKTLALKLRGDDGALVADKVSRLLATVTGIDATSTGTTNLFTVPTGKTAIVEKVVLRVTAATSANGDAAAGVGIAAGEDDIVSSQILTGLATVEDAFNLVTGAAKFRIADAGEIIKLGIDTVDSGTSLTLAADIVGYLI